MAGRKLREITKDEYLITAYEIRLALQQYVRKNRAMGLIDSEYIDKEEGSSISLITPSKHEFLENSCVLVNKEINHRVLINKNDLGGFNLFSCYLKDQTFCPYEVNK